MYKLLLFFSLILSLHAFPALAAELTGRDEALEAQLLYAWNNKLNALYADEGIPVPSADGYSASWGCVIKRGGNTQELIDQKKHWDLAIVSAKDVDLQQLANAGILYGYPRYFPEQATECHQWLHRDLWDLLPEDTTKRYNVYFYERTADDVTLLICNGSTQKKRNGNAQDYAMTYLSMRSPDLMRHTDGLVYITDVTPEELLVTDPSAWDMASIMMDTSDKLPDLDEAGLLLDLRLDPYLAQRQALTHDQSRRPNYLPEGFYANDGRMIALPYAACVLDRRGALVSVNALVINPKSPYAAVALDYAVHMIKSVEWRWMWQCMPHDPSDPALDRSDMNW